MPTARTVITGTGGAVLLLAAVTILVIGRDTLDKALPPVLNAALVCAAAWAAIAGGSWLLVHAWNAQHRQPAETSPRAEDSNQH